MFVFPNHAVEEALVDYLIQTVDPLQTTASYYTGLGNIETLEAPAVMVSCGNGTQAVPGFRTNIWDFAVTITVKEMAADTLSASLGVLSVNVYNAMADPNLVSKVKNANSWSFSPYQIYEMDLPENQQVEDTLYSQMIYRVVGALSGSV